MKYLGRGRMRLAFKIGKVVVKIPYTLKGIMACYEERQLWDRHRSYTMAPILFSIPGLLVVMPYYSKPYRYQLSAGFKAELNAFGIIDLHTYNVRDRGDGIPVAIDYAINKATGSGKPGCPTGGWAKA